MYNQPHTKLSNTDPSPSIVLRHNARSQGLYRGPKVSGQGNDIWMHTCTCAHAQPLSETEIQLNRGTEPPAPIPRYIVIDHVTFTTYHSISPTPCTRGLDHAAPKKKKKKKPPSGPQHPHLGSCIHLPPCFIPAGPSLTE